MTQNHWRVDNKRTYLTVSVIMHVRSANPHRMKFDPYIKRPQKLFFARNIWKIT